jgi:hypothetical protein
MDGAVMDIGSDVVAHGRAYVVLSTLTARDATQQLEGSILILTDPLVFREYARLLSMMDTWKISEAFSNGHWLPAKCFISAVPKAT